MIDFRVLLEVNQAVIMKILPLIPIAGALSLYGSAFTGLWTPPGLETLPTYRSLCGQLPGEEADKSGLPAGTTALAVTEQLKASGVVGSWKGRTVTELPRSLFAWARVRGGEPEKPAPPRQALPPRWYTTNPLPEPEPKVATTYYPGARSSNPQTRQLATSGAGGSGARSRNYTTSRQRSSRTRASRRR